MGGVTVLPVDSPAIAKRYIGWLRQRITHKAHSILIIILTLGFYTKKADVNVVQTVYIKKKLYVL